jgi:hypothetical protein
MQLFDVVNDLLACGIWIAAWSRGFPDTRKLTAVDVLQQHVDVSGELLRSASRDRMLAAIIHTPTAEPSEPASTNIYTACSAPIDHTALDSLLTLATDRARFHGSRMITLFSAPENQALTTATSEYRFGEHQRWPHLSDANDMPAGPSPADVFMPRPFVELHRLERS